MNEQLENNLQDWVDCYIKTKNGGKEYDGSDLREEDEREED